MPDKPKIEPPRDDYVKLVATEAGRNGALVQTLIGYVEFTVEA